MKNLLFVIMTIGLISCSKTFTIKPEEDLMSHLSVQTKAVLSQKDLTAMKQSYSMLSDMEQELLWKAKLNYIIRHDELTTGQRAILGKLLSFLTETGISRMKENDSLPDQFIKIYASKFYQNFTAEQLYFIIEHPFIRKGFSLRNSRDYLSSLSISNNKSVANGNLRVAGSCTCRYDIGCGFGNSCNKGSGCSGGRDCGLFGTSACKGNCDRGSGGPVLY